ncbi:MAG TPA: ABC transporter permease [Hyphomicrobiales bacterium]|nr:ABC transporter permease [Hyphomicrobiales bacterium]
MILGHLKFALRQLAGNWLYSAINIIGLSIGLACCLLILLYVRFESSYDQAWQQSDSLYRISREYYPLEGARARVPASNNAPVAPALLEDFPDLVQAAARVFGGDVFLEAGDIGFQERAVRFADPSLLEVFDFQWLAGDPATALDAPASIVLTESLARKYFGSTDVVGETLRLLQQMDLRVTGVIADLPLNTHLNLDGVVSLSTVAMGFGSTFLQAWNRNTDFHTYLRLQSPAAAQPLQQRLGDFLSRHASAEAAQASSLVMMPIADIHLHSDRDEEWLPPGNIGTVRAFIVIAFAILAIACINFLSIATARSTRRAKEVGMRKAIGATRLQLALQFLAESGLTVLLSLLGALALMEVALPAFGAFTHIPVSRMALLDGRMLTTFALLLMTLSVLAGAWSAFFMSSLKSAAALGGVMVQKGVWTRNVLVVCQFAIAITLVVATLVIQTQRSFIGNADLGFDKEAIVALRTPEIRGFGEQWPALKNALLASPAIEEVTASHYLPFGFNDNQVPIKLRGSAVETRIQYMLVDYDFFETYGIGLLAGRAFSEDFPSDVLATNDEEGTALAFALNRSAARALGMNPDEAVNATLEFPGALFSGTVVGVTEDVYFETFRMGERPLIFILAPPQVEQPFNTMRDASIRVAPGAMAAALAHIDATWTALNPGKPLNRHFLQEDFDALYLADARQGQLLTVFAGIAIALACFGLFGLASFNAEKRTKEIGVRKVMGSGVWNIVWLLTNDFSKLVLIANLIAWPVAWLAMERWLEAFAYRIDLTPLLFIGSSAIAFCIAWVTVGGIAAKAASAKPVLALRYE